MSVSVSVDSDLDAMYSDYYAENPELTRKRQLSAECAVDHIVALHPRPLGRVVDVGAGNGNVIGELVRRNAVTEISALEISASGLESIRERNLALVKDIRQFDGYKIPYADNAFDTAVCIHVLEHVEHERLFLREIGRIADNIIIEIPLEGGARGKTYYKHGHINYYTPLSITALFESSDFEIVKLNIITFDLKYEQFCRGKFAGFAFSFVRNALLRIFGRHAVHLMTYFAVAHLRKKSS